MNYCSSYKKKTFKQSPFICLHVSVFGHYWGQSIGVCWGGGCHSFTNLEFTLSDDACKVKKCSNVVLDFQPFPVNLKLNQKPFLGPNY